MLGALYQIKIAKKGYVDDDEYPCWHIDDSAVIFVDKKGQISLHARMEVEKGNLDSPLTHICINDFLSQPCLHYTEENTNQIFNFN
ncbi:Uncharacterised protein [Legionella busanensis]|uniref:Uncharacterized protein n=2 Tax=Legionella busanensis TaxID=190655 RepID=A0A378JLJ0_9GAMM|nr:Uncharacterised protein [Legionella busanensis]